MNKDVAGSDPAEGAGDVIERELKRRDAEELEEKEASKPKQPKDRAPVQDDYPN